MRVGNSLPVGQSVAAHLARCGRGPGYFTIRSDTHPNVKVRTSGIYLRADPEDISILDGRDDRKRLELITERLRHGKSM
jgi:hypothetical protein